ncbi:MAG TPA: hypothetical protein VF322_05120 [Gammaproteobacteria bacterium]
MTNTVQVSSPHQVRAAVAALFRTLYPRVSFDPVWLAFHDFERVFGGLDEYHPVDTPYHDIQHTLDMTLALARLIAGYESTAEPADALGPERAALAVVCGLFHDSGYLRHRERDRGAAHGAEFTRSHVSRSGRFLESYLPRIGLGHFVPVAARIVHFTGYEVDIERIELDEPKDSLVGHLLGTADLMAQLADRCYLEKCRDRLYPEFVVGGVALGESPTNARYRSGRDLLSKTLAFYQSSVRRRLEHNFNGAYRYMEAYFEHGENPYVFFLRKNLSFLSTVIANGSWDKLRRRPACVIPDASGEARLLRLAFERARDWAAPKPGGTPSFAAAT